MIFFYTACNVKKGEELFFNYDETGKLAEYFDWAGNPQKRRKDEKKKEIKAMMRAHKRRAKKRRHPIEEKVQDESNSDHPIQNTVHTPLDLEIANKQSENLDEMVPPNQGEVFKIMKT